MAKAKKTESAETPKAEKPKAAAKKAPVKAKSPAAPTSAPLIDTNLAAQNAARLLAAGFNKPVASEGGSGESAMFKQMKAGLNKPASLNPLLDTGTNTGLNRATSGFKPNQQSANYNANVARTGVPRRNPG